MKRMTFVTLALCAVVPAIAQERLEPGLWSVTPLLQGQPVGAATERCITAEEAKSANGDEKGIAAALSAENRKGKCTIKDLKLDGPRIRFSTVCQGMTMASDLTYAKTSYEGTMTMSGPGGDQQVIGTRGRRIGACP
ncbi:hypothetical protein A1351_16285 [Methylosinus sp. R-45379]|uniref:DUF3617 domain-containing protein n=1 Tax=unclassified Methylosinus TaxID=2624500 RepID=UPI00046696DA|nr:MULTISPECIES: DUF3617 family protein [unclassified Methylosinus]OAI25598.1 hypothetical protein A1351_16285 [Methylosinus sp. R-45379]TDX62526.1 uncharacterized protein DUF3617 [Methylosinus sp. sav-2]